MLFRADGARTLSRTKLILWKKCSEIDAKTRAEIQTRSRCRSPFSKVFIHHEERLSKQSTKNIVIDVYSLTEHLQAAQLLLECGSDVNSKDSFGLTPLLGAAARNMTSLFVKIEQMGADMTVRN